MSEKHFEDKKHFLQQFSQRTKELLFQQPSSGWSHEIQTHRAAEFSRKNTTDRRWRRAVFHGKNFESHLHPPSETVYHAERILSTKQQQYLLLILKGSVLNYFWNILMVYSSLGDFQIKRNLSSYAFTHRHHAYKIMHKMKSLACYQILTQDQF